MELDALTSSVLELARRLDIATPTLDALGALARLQGEVWGFISAGQRSRRLLLPRHPALGHDHRCFQCNAQELSLTYIQ